MDEGQKAKIASQFIGAIPYAKTLGMELLEIHPGKAMMSVGYRPEFVGDPSTGVLSGGVVTALLDTCSGAAVMSHDAAPMATATIDLRIDYMRPAPVGETIFAEADCFRVTQTVAFVRAPAYAGDKEKPIATAAGAFTLDRPSARDA